MTTPGQDLRALFLRQKPADVKLSPSEDLPHVWAAMMEWQQNNSLVTFVAIADGSTSLYFSKSGGIIGAGEHESVRTASRKFLTTVEGFLDAGAFVQRDAPLDVPKGAVSVAVFTYDGLRVARDTETRLEKRESPIWPLFYLMHDVIAKAREVMEKKPGG